jgi:DNA topoisomerase VI subunit B
MKTQLKRTTFQTSRLLNYFSRKELIAQIGHESESWPLVAIKELIDNALDACEDAGIPPSIEVTIDEGGITVIDNGPGLPAETVAGIVNFEVRVSSREAYVSPTRGAQGNAFKTLVAMPYVLGERGHVEIASCGIRHTISATVDRVQQLPILDHRPEFDTNVKNGTLVRIHSAALPRSLLEGGNERFLQLVHGFAFLNPHLSVTWNWFGEVEAIAATNVEAKKWRPNEPTSVHWYSLEAFERLIAAYLGHSGEPQRSQTVRDFIIEFAGLSGTAKAKRVLEETGLFRAPLSVLSSNDGLKHELTDRLLVSMKRNTRPIKPAALGVIGTDHLRARFDAIGCKMPTFQYKRQTCSRDSIPSVLEVAFAWNPEANGRRLVTGVNWSPAIPGTNPFRKLGRQSLDAILANARADEDESVLVFLHLAMPGVQYTDRAKSTLIIDSTKD